MTLGTKKVLCFIVDPQLASIEKHIPAINTKEFKTHGYTCCSFSPSDGTCFVGTMEGNIIVLTDRSLSNLSLVLPKGEKSATKTLKYTID
jgi:hypothetical protein